MARFHAVKIVLVGKTLSSRAGWIQLFPSPKKLDPGLRRDAKLTGPENSADQSAAGSPIATKSGLSNESRVL